MTRFDLFNSFTSAHLAEALRELQLPSGGSKPDRVQRLISQDAPASEILISFSADALRRVCTMSDIPAGSKVEMAERLAALAADQASPDSETSSSPHPKPTSSIGFLSTLSYQTTGKTIMVLVVIAAMIFLAFFKDDLQRKASVRSISDGTAVTLGSPLTQRPLNDPTTPTELPNSTSDASGPIQTGQARSEPDAGRPGEIVEPDLEEVISSAKILATPLDGGVVRLDDGGAAFEVPTGSIDIETELRLVRTKMPPGAPTGMVTDAYYPLSTSRPTLSGNITLSIPYDPSSLPFGVEEANLRAYAILEGGAVYPEPATVDTDRNIVLIPNPRVRALEIPELQLEADNSPIARPVIPDPPNSLAAQQRDFATFTGYGVNGKELTSSELLCSTGAAGEIHDEPDTVFRIFNRVSAPCDFVRFVATTLQEAADNYNARFANRKGQMPFEEFTVENRMMVTLGDFPAFSGNYDFMLWGPVPDWSGEIEIDVTKGSSNRSLLRGTLFHEMFHGVQDFYSNMYLAGNVARWWYEATAEWAGLQARNVNFADAQNHELNTFNYALSVPVADSESFSPQLPYAYAILVYHVEEQSPGYVYDSLNDSNQVSSGDFYRALVESGNLDSNYIDFVSRVMADRLPGALWTTASIFERANGTNVFSRIDLPAGTSDSRNTVITEAGERYGPISFSGWIQPLTSRFFQVTLQGATGPRSVDISLTSVDSDARLLELPSHDALILVGDSKAVPGAIGAPTRISQNGQATMAINETNRNLWVAVVNTLPDSRRHYTLTLRLSKMSDKWPLSGTSSNRCSSGSGVHWEYNFGSANLPGSTISGSIQLFSRDDCFLRNKIYASGIIPGSGTQTIDMTVKDGFGNALGFITFNRDGSFTPDPISFVK